MLKVSFGTFAFVIVGTKFKALSDENIPALWAIEL